MARALFEVLLLILYIPAVVFAGFLFIAILGEIFDNGRRFR